MISEKDRFNEENATGHKLENDMIDCGGAGKKNPNLELNKPEELPGLLRKRQPRQRDQQTLKFGMLEDEGVAAVWTAGDSSTK